jgi:hypothetical protein
MAEPCKIHQMHSHGSLLDLFAAAPMQDLSHFFGPPCMLGKNQSAVDIAHQPSEASGRISPEMR